MRRGKVVWLWLAGACAGLLLVACSDDAKKGEVGDPCENNTDCADEICHLGVCAAKNPLKVGEACASSAECRSFSCANGFCVPGNRGLGDPCRFNIECLSESCQIEGSLPGLCVDQASPPDGAVPDAAQDAGPPDATQADMAQADMAQADMAQPDMAQPDMAQADMAQPDQLMPDQLQPDTLPPDLGPCGNKNEPCCGGLCNAPLACVGGTCVCGGKDQPCCTGDTCDANLTCLTSSTNTCACGGLQQACCNGTTCNGSLFCAGQACACIKFIDGSHYIRTDGTVWYQDYPNVNKAVGPLSGAEQVVHAGHYHACARKSDGTVWCWSRHTYYGNLFGQLGDGTFVTPATNDVATQVKVDASTYLTGVNSISAAGSFGGFNGTTCAVKSDGTVWCWGESQQGVLFQETADSDKAFATQIKASATSMLSGATQVSVNYKHACAVVGSGLACWGANGSGQLGAGDTSAHQYPQLVTIPGKTVKKVSAGINVSCALTTSNEVYCWGANEFGQCGLGYPSAAIPTPTPVLQSGGGNLTDVKEIAVGDQMACAVKNDGALLCWGRWPSSHPSATQILDGNSNPITDAVQVTTVHHDYRILRTSGTYYSGTSGTLSHACP